MDRPRTEIPDLDFTLDFTTCITLGMFVTDEQGGNSNLDCVPRTAVVAISDGGGGGVLSSNFVHQMCHRGGGGVAP